MTRRALITGVTGQDGSYLAEFLIARGYEVHGLKRRSSSFNTERVDHLYQEGEESHDVSPTFKLHYGDLVDSSGLIKVVEEIQPDEIYNLGAMSHVKVSFEMPEYTAEVGALGTLRLLEAIRLLGLSARTRFYQASTSELYGLVHEVPQKETTPFHPRSPYAIAKLYAHWTTINYREAYGIYACNGILFNHESPRRGPTFVTRKISRAISRIACGLQKRLHLGNLDAKRDWGHARDYIEMEWLMLQQAQAADYVIATGRQETVRRFVELCCLHVGIPLRWQGTGSEEKGFDDRTGACVVDVDPHYFRPTEVESLLGDASKARERLGWTARTTLEQLVAEMMEHDLDIARRERLAVDHGFPVIQPRE